MLWVATKRIRRPTQSNSPLRRDDNTRAKSDKEKADLFAEHFHKVFRTNDLASTIQSTPLNLEGGNIKHTTPLEVASVIDQLKICKSPGHDRITPIVLRELSRKCIVPITNFFNASFHLKHVSSAWKTARMIVILKPGKSPENPDSYRPILLLTILSKVYEKILLSRIRTIINTKNLIPDIQFGFRAKHSTTEQVHRIVHEIAQALENKEFDPAIFLDVSAAFDKVWHLGLLHKIQPHFPPALCKLILDYLTSRKFYIQFGEATSDLMPIGAGVPQGSVLGPTLYTLYTMTDRCHHKFICR